MMESLHDESKITLTAKEYESITTAVGIAEHCVYCIDTHANAMIAAATTHEDRAALIHLVSTRCARGLLRRSGG